MNGILPRRCGGSAGGRRSFTLVELVTAASLMTVMMVGVVQIFAIVTQTAAEAEGLSFAQQEMRALFDRLHNELRGMTREGYLRLFPGAIVPSGVTFTYNGSPASLPLSQRSGWYAADTLAFVSIGPFWSAGWQGTATYSAPCAELVYTNYVKTPTILLEVKSGTNPPTMKDNPRRGVLGRGQWLISGSSGSAADTVDLSAAGYLYELFANQSMTTSAGINRISKVSNSPYLAVWPWTLATGTTAQKPSLRRVMASCASEFYVEAYDPSIDNFKSMPSSSNYTASNSGFNSWPRALRVTAAVHDPGDAKPLASSTNTRFQGYAMQEIFWISDP